MLGLGKGHDHGEWYTNWRKHPGRNIVALGGMKHDLTPLQDGRCLGFDGKKFDVYEPIKAWSEQWHHDKKGDNHYPIEGTKVRNDLPPLYLQWREDYKERFC